MPGFLTRAASRAFRNRPAARRASALRRLAPALESLEGRQLLATAGTDYALSGFQWATPAHLTYSIAPDGVFWDHGPNTLQAALDARLGPGNWERDLARALATWEASANLNIAQTGDAPLDFNTLGLAQGDPRFGDIRFGGYAFAGNTTTLAQTYYPPPNGATAAGDVEVNLNMDFHDGSNYDFFSVMLHETGHALGLDHATNPASVMNPIYQGVRSGLAPGDVAGIQALYGPRASDPYRLAGLGLGFGSAIDASAALDANGQATLKNASLAAIGATEYFKVVAPAGASGALWVTAAADGWSLLSPRVTLYDAAFRPVDAAASPAAWGDNVTATAAAVQPGQVYYVAVTGATSDVFAVGAYALHLAFNGLPGGTSPTPTPTPTPIGMPAPAPVGPAPSPAPAPTVFVIPPDPLEPNNTTAQATALGTLGQASLANLSLDTAADVDAFSFRNARPGVVTISAAGTFVRLTDAAGRTLASGFGQVTARLARARGVDYVVISAPSGAPVASYTLAVNVATTGRAPARRVRAAKANHALALGAATPQGRHPAGPALALAWPASHGHGA